MLVLATPMVGFFFAAVGVATLLDRRRARREPTWAKVADDEASPLDDQAQPLDDATSPLEDAAGPLKAGPLDDEASPL
jgi:hypothetical protein